MNLYELQEKLTNDDLITLIKKRLPDTNTEIKIVIAKAEQEFAYIDVSFYFELGLKYPEVLYTHLYHSELIDYIKEKSDVYSIQ